MHGIRKMQSMMRFTFTLDMTPCRSVFGFRCFEQWSRDQHVVSKRQGAFIE
jgi:hypothetical protein